MLKMLTVYKMAICSSRACLLEVLTLDFLTSMHLVAVIQKHHKAAERSKCHGALEKQPWLNGLLRFSSVWWNRHGVDSFCPTHSNLPGWLKDLAVLQTSINIDSIVPFGIFFGHLHAQVCREGNMIAY